MTFLKQLGKPLLEYLQPLFQACFHYSYHPPHFKQSSTVALRKLGKGDYSAPAAQQSVALLNTLGKVIENVVACRITALIEEHGLLPPQQMGACLRRSTATALDMLIKHIWVLIWTHPYSLWTCPFSLWTRPFSLWTGPAMH
jgi:hypothetical protein